MSNLQTHPAPPPCNSSDHTPPAHRNLTTITFALATFALAAFGVFVLPFFFPPTHLALSAAYSAGFNNRAADLAAAFVACLTFFVAWRFRLYPHTQPQHDPRPTPRLVLALSIAACIAFNGFLGWMSARTNLAVYDARYFLEAMDDVIRYHLHIYSGFNFAYGPLLLYLPIWIHSLLAPFHTGTQGAYYTALVLMQCLGLLLLHATLKALQVPRAVHVPAFVVLTLTTFNPILGINYTLVRSLLPFATLLFAARAKTPRALAIFFFLGELLQLAVSPELGFAFAAGACFYALCLAIRDRHNRPLGWLPAIAAPLAAAALFLAIFGKAYLASVFTFANGDYNLIVEPLGYILLFLLCLVWIVPRSLAADFRRHHPQALLRAGLFVLSIGLLPAALGRCEPLHVLFAGLGVYVLAVAALAPWSAPTRNLWLILFAGIIAWTQCVSFIYHQQPRVAAAILYRHAPWQESIDIARLRTLTGGQPVSVPFMIPLNIERQIKHSYLYLPDREEFRINVGDPASEDAKAARMNKTGWALIPAQIPESVYTPQTTSVSVGFGYNFYPVRQKPYISGAIIAHDLKAHWTPVASFGKWVLYHRKQREQR
ncbi:MAG TPA: hypothetical protein VMU92_01615 [Acidobacteriaceae bacterium]|nr:hypothetical protein [Acidobacteriaceae bacterium]